MMNKWLMGTVAAGMLALAPTFVSATELTVATAAPLASPWGQWISGVGERTSELSNGELTLDVHYSAELGGEQVTTRQTARGRIDIVGASNTALSVLAPEMQLFQMPYLWDSEAQMDCVYDNHLVTVIADLLSEKGLTTLAYIEIGPYLLYSKDPIRVPADLAGVKVRVGPASVNADYMNSLGAHAVPLSVVDTAPALKTGGVDVAEYGAVFGIATGTHKLAPNILITHHAHINGGLSINNDVWASLTEDQQTALTTALAESAGGLRASVRGAGAHLLNQVKEAGIPVTELTAEERALWAAPAPAVQQRLIDSLGGKSAEVWAAIQAGKAACGS